ncbi:restriction endonuclease subunit S [Geothrix mesophila]|uniref:restriction endonuclease subunit S n=1 Tax=Geothrix mesophila TaxID=2922723 RepID=UPI001FAE6184|nr:restriction endonuclease subunit S [Geothrix sp. SG198]
MAAKLNWPMKSLGSLAEFRNGVNYNKSSFGQGIKVVGVSNFQDYTKPRYAELEQINPDGIVTERNILRDGDIVFVRSNGNRELIGRSLFIEKPPEEITHSAFTIRLRFTSSEVHPKFFAYCFRTPLIRQALTAQGGGTNINNLNQDILGSLEVPLPSLAVQQRTAGILSAYDDLIENSQRRIKILESMARALYREWFVNFRFPGHEGHPQVASPLGEIPKGWGLAPLFDLATVNYGRTLPTKQMNEDGEHPVYGAAKIIGRHTEYNREHRTIICGCRGSVGEMQITEEFCFVTNNSFTFDPTHPDNFFWLFNGLKERGLRDVVGGSAQPQITLEGISSVVILTPPLQLRTSYQEAVAPIFEQAWALDRQIQNLRRTRDLLLPRLLTGQIGVEVA